MNVTSTAPLVPKSLKTTVLKSVFRPTVTVGEATLIVGARPTFCTASPAAGVVVSRFTIGVKAGSLNVTDVPLANAVMPVAPNAPPAAAVVIAFAISVASCVAVSKTVKLTASAPGWSGRPPTRWNWNVTLPFVPSLTMNVWPSAIAPVTVICVPSPRSPLPLNRMLIPLPVLPGKLTPLAAKPTVTAPPVPNPEDPEYTWSTAIAPFV